MYKKITGCSSLLLALALGACSSGGSSTADTEMSPSDDQVSEGSDESNSLSTAIQGAWMGSCSNFESQGVSVREMNAITSSQIVQDFYEYDGNDCQGVPRGITYPLRIYDYVLGSDIAAGDGISAAQLDLVVTQISDTGYLRDGVQLNDMRYDIIGVDADGKLLRTRAESSSVDNRPATLDIAVVMMPRTPLTASSINALDLVGSYTTGCTVRTGPGSSSVTESIDENGTMTSVETLYFNETCSGEPDAATQRITQFVYGDEKSSVFGDTLRQIMSTQNPKTILYGEEALSELDLGDVRVRYDAITLVGDTMFRGDCIVRVEHCKRDEEHYADMIDLEFNSSVRYTRVQP